MFQNKFQTGTNLSFILIAYETKSMQFAVRHVTICMHRAFIPHPVHDKWYLMRFRGISSQVAWYRVSVQVMSVLGYFNSDGSPWLLVNEGRGFFLTVGKIFTLQASCSIWLMTWRVNKKYRVLMRILLTSFGADVSWRWPCTGNKLSNSSELSLFR